MRQANSGTRTRAMIRIILLPAAIAVLTGCVPGGDAATRIEAPAQPLPGTQLLERDVEAPEVFRAADAALWDGRPSLGGIWVAAPDVRDPERVIMKNPGNGQSVVGALFRRERVTPGPPLQLSSEAAVALGILAGAPTQIEVIALREAAPVAVTPGLTVAPPADAPPDAVASGAPTVATPDAAPRGLGPLRRLFRRAPPGPASVTTLAPGPAPSVAPVQRPDRTPA